MNAKVEEFINKMKEEQKEKELKKRKEHLVSLGLIDENKGTYKTSKVFPNEEGWHFDFKEQVYYKGTKSAIEVTEEEYQEILKYAPLEETKKATPEKDTTWANAIKTIANILLALNIIGGIILSIIFVINDRYTEDFAWKPIVSALQYCILWYPLIIGFSKIVKAAELRL